MKKIYALNGERLDQIVFREYKTLKYFEKVVESNPHLKNKVLLDETDFIYLPKIKEENKIKMDSLW
ncbi:MAG TPA: tail protein X [Aliarcobacter sp.]|nr:tail protein X [Aliarcobacter sp.]